MAITHTTEHEAATLAVKTARYYHAVRGHTVVIPTAARDLSVHASRCEKPFAVLRDRDERDCSP